jgi:hypothetical protein
MYFISKSMQKNDDTLSDALHAQKGNIHQSFGSSCFGQ